MLYDDSLKRIAKKAQIEEDEYESPEELFQRIKAEMPELSDQAEGIYRHYLDAQFEIDQTCIERLSELMLRRNLRNPR